MKVKHFPKKDPSFTSVYFRQKGLVSSMCVRDRERKREEERGWREKRKSSEDTKAQNNQSGKK